MVDDRLTTLPGQIIDIQDYRDISKMERSCISVEPKCGRTRMVLIQVRGFLKGREVNLPNPVQYSHVPDSVKEVADSLKVEWINGRNVISPCLIFHIETIQCGTFSCRGMERLFFIRF
jgi:hypothetical protein